MSTLFIRQRDKTALAAAGFTVDYVEDSTQAAARSTAYVTRQEET
ncbi:hypothetical protein SAMN05421630_102526 [Prauserella marina]|uniref:Uncharacterized protein n=1 Tax=Prauserella marina TaxID=530584 RepID=A0A1G6MH93_9PSEU|nr:hypothetical protein [Prauserella marina]PWV85438.1 hypothetical protein DES30_1011465 [Prauserella marina]SDC54811.1 hypothetical protein SAMN05421630_102526 [Prauserella marina]